MKQLKIAITRASNGFVRKEGRLFTNPETFERVLPKKNGADIETHKSGDMQATIKGKVVGYFWDAEGVGYFFESAKDFASFLKKAEKGEFGEATEKKEKKSKKGAKGKKKGKDSDTPAKGRRRRAVVDDEGDNEEPNIDLDEIVNEDASNSANALEVLKVLKKEIKRVKVKSENINDLVGVIEDYLKEAKKEKPSAGKSPKATHKGKHVDEDSEEDVPKKGKGKGKKAKPVPRRKPKSASSASDTSSSSGNDSSDASDSKKKSKKAKSASSSENDAVPSSSSSDDSSDD